MKTLLLCSYRPVDPGEVAVGLALIDRRIDQLNALGTPPVCVLAGASADEMLRHSHRLRACEFVFDDNPEPNLASNLLAGLKAVPGAACFVLPVEIPPLSAQEWRNLYQGARNAALQGDVTLALPVGREGAPWQFGFPLVITRYGNRELEKLKDLKSLKDTRLKYLQVVIEPEPGVASTPNSL